MEAGIILFFMTISFLYGFFIGRISTHNGKGGTK